MAVNQSGALIHELEILPKSALINQSTYVDYLRLLDNLRQDKLQFSPFGLFTICRGTITSIVSAITTYIIVLMQFRTSGEPFCRPGNPNTLINITDLNVTN